MSFNTCDSPYGEYYEKYCEECCATDGTSIPGCGCECSKEDMIKCMKMRDFLVNR